MNSLNFFRTNANRRQTECNEDCFDCRGAKEEKPEGLNHLRVYESCADASHSRIAQLLSISLSESPNHPEKIYYP